MLWYVYAIYVCYEPRLDKYHVKLILVMKICQYRTLAIATIRDLKLPKVILDKNNALVY